MLDTKILNPFRARLHEKNKKWCPDEKIRLSIFVEEHFVDRFMRRFTTSHGMRLIQELEEWIDNNYCLLLFDAFVNSEPHKYRINLKHGTICLVLFEKTLRVRTCFIEGEEDA